MKRAYYVWVTTYPNDPILEGEVIHHKDENKENDSPDNLEKMSDFDHKSMHSDVGKASLDQWRKDNPEEAKAQSSNNASIMRAKVWDDPVRYKQMCDKRRKTMQSEAYRKKMSEAQKRRWRKKKEDQECQV